jgi:hypothetical protein
MKFFLERKMNEIGLNVPDNKMLPEDQNIMPLPSPPPQPVLDSLNFNDQLKIALIRDLLTPR